MYYETLTDEEWKKAVQKIHADRQAYLAKKKAEEQVKKVKK